MSVKWWPYLGRTIWAALSTPIRLRELFAQINFVAYQSLGIIVVCVSFAAVVTILEASFHMKLVIHNDAMVPGFAALLILRELGSVVSSLLLTSRVGAGLAAEVGTMRVTDQIDALRMLGIDPIRFLVVPRFWACLVGGCLLSIVANLVCLYFAMLVSAIKLGYTFGTFISAMTVFVHFNELLFAAIKGTCFGAVIPIISCFHGFNCRAGAEGVGRATTNSVVHATIAIILLDFGLGWMFSYLY